MKITNRPQEMTRVSLLGLTVLYLVAFGVGCKSMLSGNIPFRLTSMAVVCFALMVIGVMILGTLGKARHSKTVKPLPIQVVPFMLPALLIGMFFGPLERFGVAGGCLAGIYSARFVALALSKNLKLSDRFGNWP